MTLILARILTSDPSIPRPLSAKLGVVYVSTSGNNFYAEKGLAYIDVAGVTCGGLKLDSDLRSVANVAAVYTDLDLTAKFGIS